MNIFPREGSDAPGKVPTVNIRPEVTILSILKHLNYRPWFALAEFVDNALQSYLKQHDAIKSVDGAASRLVVEIDINTDDHGQISIRDNAGGILASEFPRAFRPAELPPDRNGLSEFGMGMKSAACWFAKEWSVRTSALGEPVERTVTFNIDKIVTDQISSLHVKERPVPENDHFTEVALWHLHHPPKGRTLGKIKEHLASIYRVFLQNGTLTLKLNGESLAYEEPDILLAPYHRALDGEPKLWKKEINFDFGGGQVVRGFAAIRDIASTAYAGFALFRRNRLIEGSGDDAYRPSLIFGNSNSYRYQRLFGELHLEGFEVSHTKDGFRWEEFEDIFLDCLKDELEKEPLNLLDQAEGHRKRQSGRTIEIKAQEATNNVAVVIEDKLPPVFQKESENPSKPAPLPESIPKSSFQSSERTVLVKDNGQTWEITIETTTDPAIGPWLRIGGTDSRLDADGQTIRSLIIDVSLGHPFSQQFLGANNEGLELMLRLAAGFSLALILTQKAGGGGASFPLHHLNSLLRDALSSP